MWHRISMFLLSVSVSIWPQYCSSSSTLLKSLSLTLYTLFFSIKKDCQASILFFCILSSFNSSLLIYLTNIFVSNINSFKNSCYLWNVIRNSPASNLTLSSLVLGSYFLTLVHPQLASHFRWIVPWNSNFRTISFNCPKVYFFTPIVCHNH
jgi:hypothetical protein